MNSILSFHSAPQRSEAIRRAMDERRADRLRHITITVSGGEVTLDGIVEHYDDKSAAVDAALFAGEAEVVIDRIAVRRMVR